MAQSQFWCFTWNNYPLTWKTTLKKMDYSYIVVGKEVGDSGTKHLQGYVELKKKIRLTGLKKIHMKISWGNRKGSSEEASNYCKKGEQSHSEWAKLKENGPNYGKNADVFEEGKISVSQQGKRNDIVQAREIARESGRMSNVVEKVESYQAIKVAECYLKYSGKRRDWKPTVSWFYGPTGSGKTRRAFEEANDPWISGKNLKWWEGYDGHEDVIIDDFRRDFCTFHELLRILDRYEYRVECKGRSRQLLAKNIWITSAFHPSEVYNTREDLGQLLRRIDNIVLIDDDVSVTEVGGNTSPDLDHNLDN